MKEFVDSVLFVPPPEISGIYFLMLGDEIVYIGMSENIHFRVSYHVLENTKKFDSIRAFYFNVTGHRARYGMLGRLERKLINHYLPKYNSDPKTQGLKNKKTLNDLQSIQVAGNIP